MTALGRILSNVLGRRAAPPHRRAARPVIRARYDAAQTYPGNRDHWTGADALSPLAANTPAVRKRLRERARYERDNDPHLNGLTKTLAYDLVGTGPRLQLTLGEENYAAAQVVERAFAAWSRAVNFADKLRLMQEARPTDGESFGRLVTNAAVPHPVKLDLEVLESELIDTPTNAGFAVPIEQGYWDGIEFDPAGNPTVYHVLRQHPGSGLLIALTGEIDYVPARNMVHWFRPTRPGQTRGVCELAAVLPIGSQTRRYAAAVLTAAEFAAKLAGVMSTNGPAGGDEGVDTSIEAMDEIALPNGALLTLPEGWDAKQFEAKQPTGSYVEFVTSKRAEMGRTVGMPRNQVTGDSSAFNFASGQLDGKPYQRMLWIERDQLRYRVVDRLFLAFVRELGALGLVPDSLPPIAEWIWDWHWDGFAALDPVKETTATSQRLSLGLTTLAEEAAAEGKNWREVIDQRAVELRYAESKGVPLTAPPAKAAPTVDQTDPAEVVNAQ